MHDRFPRCAGSLSASSTSQTHPLVGALVSLMNSAMWSRGFYRHLGGFREEEVIVALNKPKKDTDGEVPWEAVTLCGTFISKDRGDLAPSHLFTDDVGCVALRCGVLPAQTYSCLLEPTPPQN